MSDATSQQLVVFSLGNEEYALPIGAVHEIIRFTEPRMVASDAAWIRGVIGLRGKIIAIFDVAGRMGLEAVSTEPKIVIVESPASARVDVATGAVTVREAGGQDTDLTHELEKAA